MVRTLLRLVEEQQSLIAVTADRIKAKDKVHCIHISVICDSDFCYFSIFPNIIQLFPLPPTFLTP